MSLNDDEVRSILARAAEIEKDFQPGPGDIDAIVGAADEVGIARSAVEQALRERGTMPVRSLGEGELVFASSTGDKYHVATVIHTRHASEPGAEPMVRVRFLRGGERELPYTALRPCSFIPGERVTCDWPGWGAWTCTVLSYDEASQTVRLADGWGDSQSIPIADVWVTTPGSAARRRKRLYASLLAGGAAAGALIGSIITAAILG